MSPSGQGCRLVVCRGCCCGRRKKVPGVDHRAQLDRLSSLRDAAADHPVPVQVSKCLGICFLANVVVVQPSPAGRASGARPVWLGDVTTDAALDEIETWVKGGGPGVAPLPEPLRDHVTSKNAKKPKKSERAKKAKRLEKARKKERKARKAEKAADAAAKRADKKSGKGGKKSEKARKKAREKAAKR